MQRSAIRQFKEQFCRVERRISRIETTRRRTCSYKVGAIARNVVPDDPTIETVQLDSHADTSVFGRNFLVIAYTGRECDVMPYSDTHESVKGVSVATAWTCMNTGQTYILVIHEGLWMGELMDNSLINPNQLRAFGRTVQDNPYCRSTLYLEDPESVLTMPYETAGTNSFVTTRTPTQD